LVRQREATDCAIAVIAMLTRCSYEQIDHLRAELGYPEVGHGRGLFQDETLNIISVAGVTVVQDVPGSITDRDEGILVVRFPWQNVHQSHAVLVRNLLVFDPLSPLLKRLAEARYEWKDELYFLRVVDRR
jgi:hypothetical protein